MHCTFTLHMAFSDPKQILAESGITDGSAVADFGAGSGHYAFAAGNLVGSRGRVYAIDIQKELLSRLKREASAQGLRNIEIVWGDLEAENGSSLRGGTLDAVIIANILFQAEHRTLVLEEAKRVLKVGGRLVLIEWSDSFGGIGPRASDVLTESVARELLTRAGFTFERAIKHPGEHHYGLILKKS